MSTRHTLGEGVVRRPRRLDGTSHGANSLDRRGVEQDEHHLGAAPIRVAQHLVLELEQLTAHRRPQPFRREDLRIADVVRRRAAFLGSNLFQHVSLCPHNAER